MTTLSVLLGLDLNTPDEPMDTEPAPTYKPKTETPPPKKPEPEPELPENKRLAKAAKETGNEFYKKKDFTSALEHYQKAIEHDPTDITFYNNIAAVYYEQKLYQKCIEECQKGIEIGRENRADFKLIAKAFTRIGNKFHQLASLFYKLIISYYFMFYNYILGNSYKKLEDWYSAKNYYEKSMSEHRTPEIKSLLSDIEKKIKEAEMKAYIDPAKAEQEKELGNDYFKKGDLFYVSTSIFYHLLYCV